MPSRIATMLRRLAAGLHAPRGAEGEGESTAARMVGEQLIPRGIQDRRVLAIMGRLDRRLFVPPEWVAEAFRDAPIPIECGQTISQPYIVAFMTEALAVEPHHRVLEIGTGSGYQAAVLASLCRELVSVERWEPLAGRAAERLASLGFENIAVRVGDGTMGWEGEAPYDRIMVTAAANHIGRELLCQLAPDGVLVAPVAFHHGLIPAEDYQKLRRWRRRGAAEEWDEEDILDVRFVPLLPGVEHCR